MPLDCLNSTSLLEEVDRQGWGRIPEVVSASDCKELASYYDDPDIKFRSRINMARYNFGRGEYQYFDYPLPDLVQQLRTDLYQAIVPIANHWESQLGNDMRWPDSLDELTSHCHSKGQNRPTPLLLKYGPGDYNCLHQDLYGPIHFPLQAIILLSKPDADFTGGELLLTEQRPRMQSRGMVLPLDQGDVAIIPVRERPRLGTRGHYRVNMRHGVSEVLTGNRMTFGLIFHDAE